MYTIQVGKWGLHENKVELLLRPAFIVELSLKFDEVPGMLGSFHGFAKLLLRGQTHEDRVGWKSKSRQR